MSFHFAGGNQNLEQCLAACQWESRGTGQWIRQTEQGEAVLHQIADRGDWLQFHLEGGMLPATTAAKMLTGNFRLRGPLKFVATAAGRPVCRADLPRQFPSLSADAFCDLDGGRSDDLSRQSPLQTWAEAVTAAVAASQADGPPVEPPDEKILKLVTDAGWSASLDDGQLHVHLHLPGLFQQVYFEPAGAAGGKIAADLLMLSGVRGAWLKAALRLARAANARLPLVRLAVTEDTTPRVLRAEVCVGCAPIPGEWLLAALEAAEAAVSLVAREFQALRDPELAKLVLAADAA
jgi:hypothetical protein